MMAKRGAAKIKNDKKFAEWLAKRKRQEKNRIPNLPPDMRGKKMTLPRDVDLCDISWKPNWQERMFAKLAEMDAKFEKQQEEYRKFRIAVAQRMIEQDLKWLREHKDD